MKKSEALAFCLERLWCEFEVKKRDGRKMTVYQKNNSQAVPGAGYDYRVTISSAGEKDITYGSYAQWGGSLEVTLKPWPAESATLVLHDKKILLVRFRRTGTRFRDWGKEGIPFGQTAEEAVRLRPPDLLEAREICSLAEVENLRAGTGGGWEGEFFRERLPGEKAGQEGDRWVGILYRSNGAVTICRTREDFPF